MNNETKTLQMRLAYVLFEFDLLVQELRQDVRGPRTEKYYLFFAKLLEERLKAIRRHIEQINYVEVD